MSAKKSTVDSTLSLPGSGMPQMRPEFDVTLAYNPDSMLLPVARLGGVTFTALGADNEAAAWSPARAASCAWTAIRRRQMLGARLLYVNLGSGRRRKSAAARARRSTCCSSRPSARRAA